MCGSTCLWRVGERLRKCITPSACSISRLSADVCSHFDEFWFTKVSSDSHGDVPLRQMVWILSRFKRPLLWHAAAAAAGTALLEYWHRMVQQQQQRQQPRRPGTEAAGTERWRRKQNNNNIITNCGTHCITENDCQHPQHIKIKLCPAAEAKICSVPVPPGEREIWTHAHSD